MKRKSVFQIATVLFFLASTGHGASLQRDFSYLREPSVDLIERSMELSVFSRSPASVRMGSYLPPSLARSGRHPNGTRVAMDTARRFVEGEFLSQGAMGESTRQINRNLQSGVNMNSPTHHHSLEFRVQAVQTKASVRYVGIGQTVISYDVYAQAFQVEMSKSLSHRISLVGEHMASNEETADRVGIRWTW